MGNSFKMQKGGSGKDQAKGLGVLLIILGIVCGLFVDPRAWWLVVIGVVLLIAGAAASE